MWASCWIGEFRLKVARQQRTVSYESERVCEVTRDYFNILFTTNDSSDYDRVLNHISWCITPDIKMALDGRVLEEIMEAFK